MSARLVFFYPVAGTVVAAGGWGICLVVLVEGCAIEEDHQGKWRVRIVLPVRKSGKRGERSVNVTFELRAMETVRLEE